MTKAENRLIQAAQHAVALGTYGHETQQDARKRFIGAMKSHRRSRVFTEARIMYAEILNGRGFTCDQIAGTLGRSKQAISYYLSLFPVLKASNAVFRDKAARAMQEFNALMSL